jgi:hypothetical protein
MKITCRMYLQNVKMHYVERCFLLVVVVGRVVTRTFSDGRTDNRTMAAGAFVTWTHCSILFEVTWGKTVHVCADAHMRPRGHERICVDSHMRPRGRTRVCADIGLSARTSSPPSPLAPSPLPPLPPSLRTHSASVRTREKKYFIFYFIFSLGSCCRLGRNTIYNLQCTIYNFRFSIPKIPKISKLRELRGRSHEKKKVFSA